ncbi:hypothetical protein WJX72_002578 [[Myrmecia] bisecta]|uniref:Uncharacterized protein n=1 Tax=[Myrmecia] bisecta TaxID=41462 RepID=A0AAW1R5E5_9CHLO
MVSDDSVTVWVVVGASKGIGAALVGQVLEDKGTVVFACARQPSLSKPLTQLKSKCEERLHLITLDVTDEKSAEAAAKAIQDASATIDVLVNNAAIFESMIIATRDQKPGQMLDLMKTNAVGAHLTTRAFLPLLERGSMKTVVNMSSLAGSTRTYADMIDPKVDVPHKAFSKVQGAYRATKAALNSLTVSWALDVTPDTGFKFIALHPGIVKTEASYALIGEHGLNLDDFEGVAELLTPAESASALVKVISNLQPEDSGKFLDYKGNELPF